MGNHEGDRIMGMRRPRDVKKSAPVGPKDVHLVFHPRISDGLGPMKLFDATGRLKRTIEARGAGSNGPGYDVVSSDTPPGLYLCTDVVPTLASEGDATWASFGPWYVYLEEQEGQESSRGRAGVGLHGGRTGIPGDFTSRQVSL